MDGPALLWRAGGREWGKEKRGIDSIDERERYGIHSFIDPFPVVVYVVIRVLSI